MDRGRQECHLGGLVEKERKGQAWRRDEIGRKSGIRMVYLDSSHLLYQKKKKKFLTFIICSIQILKV